MPEILHGVVTVEPGVAIGAERGDAVVCIPVYGAHDSFVECLRRVLQHTPPDVPVYIADDASPDPRITEHVVGLAPALLGGRRVFYSQQPENLGFLGNVNAAFAACAPADVLILNSDCFVAQGWYEGMRDAALADSTTATASALSNHGSLLSVPIRNHPQSELPDGWDPDSAAAAVRAASARLRPRTPTAVGHCSYIRRSALELVGAFDPAYGRGYDEEVDFSLRCVARGLNHVVADEVFVFHKGNESFGSSPELDAHKAQAGQLTRERHPYYNDWVGSFTHSERVELAAALGAASRAIGVLSVTVDGRCLGHHQTGTQRHALELIRALAQRDRISVRVVIPAVLGDYARRALADMDVAVVTSEEAATAPRTDVVHRPYQLDDSGELSRLATMGEHLVITQQDGIAYRNPAYFPTYMQWRAYANGIEAGLFAADAVVFFSGHARQVAIDDGLVPATRAHVVYIGVDHAATFASDAAEAPAWGSEVGEDALICLGADFRHKNRVFAIKVAAAMRQHHDWQGKLLLVGPHVGWGDSADDEAALLASIDGAHEWVVRKDEVTDAERNWLFRNTRVLLQPTTVEGFGLVPFEAAAFGLPSAFAPQGSLAEVLPLEAATIVPWDAAATAANVMALVRDATERARVIQLIETAGLRFRWADAGEKLEQIYAAVVGATARQFAARAMELPRPEPRSEGIVAPPATDVEAALRGLARRPMLAKWVLSPVLVGMAVRRRARRTPRV